MVLRTAERAMPPWGAVQTAECTPPLSWKNDPRLSDAQIATIATWQSEGQLEGNPADAPPPLAAKSGGLTGAQLTLSPKQGFSITSSDKDTFRCFVLDPRLTETKYVNGVGVVPQNADIVHHALVFVDPKGASAAKVTDGSGGYDCFGGIGVEDTQLLSAWAPGGLPAEYPADVGAPITAGSLLVLQVHYHPHTVPELGQLPDATSVELRFH